MRGNIPSSVCSPALRASPVIEPMASKKFVNTRVNTSIVAARTPICWNPPTRSKAPMRPKSGSATTCCGNSGAERFQPSGSGSTGSPTVPSFANAWMMIAATVATMMPMRMPPGIRRATRMPMSTSAKTKTSVGRDPIDPSWPSWTGGPAGVRVTKPALTKPMKAMKSPMPTVMAIFSACGTALKIAVRMPVAPRTTMMMPLMITSPIASAQVTSWTTETARKLFIPRPAARPKGSRATTPKRIVMTPATSPVTAVSWAKSRLSPATSWEPPRMSGLRTTI